MLSSTRPGYHRVASRYFRLILASFEVQDKFPLTLRQLSYSEDKLEEVLSMQHSDSMKTPNDSRCKALELQRQSLSGGLIEIQD